MTLKMIPIYHNLGYKACNNIAFYIDRDKINIGDVLGYGSIIYKNNEHPKICEKLKCSSCGMLLNFINTTSCGLILYPNASDKPPKS